MLPAILISAVFILIIVLTVTLVNFFTAPMLRRSFKRKTFPRVSVLVPARNEEQNIGSCLQGLSKQDYPNYEIIVLDDFSEDRTAAIVREAALKDGRIKYHHGLPLPPDWTGKNWACFQLSQLASGEVYIFTDADNHHAPFAITHTIGYMLTYQLGLLSAFPQQETISPSEKLVVPMMDMFVYGTLPLWLTYRAPFPSLAAANGQWLAVTKQAYQKVGGHEAVRNQLVEDTELARRAKQQHIKILTTAGTDTVFCRMYHSTKEVWQGFSKNFYGLTGYNAIVFSVVILALFLACVIPYFLIFIPGVFNLALAAIILNMLIRAILSIKYKHPFWYSVIFHPFAIIFTILIGLNSIISFKRGIVYWKGRQIKI